MGVVVVELDLLLWALMFRAGKLGSGPSLTWGCVLRAALLGGDGDSDGDQGETCGGDADSDGDQGEPCGGEGGGDGGGDRETMRGGDEDGDQGSISGDDGGDGDGDGEGNDCDKLEVDVEDEDEDEVEEEELLGAILRLATGLQDARIRAISASTASLSSRSQSASETSGD